VFAAFALSANAFAVPLTHFSLNASGGFDAYIYPELTNGTPSLVGGVFTLPQTVNPGYVVILDNSASPQNITSGWDDVIHFFSTGLGPVNEIQMLRGGPNQASYYPSLNTVLHSSHAFVVKNSTGFTNFTDYSVTSTVTRNYHFYTGPFPALVPDGGSTAILLGMALIMLILLHRSLRPSSNLGR
jgi:hypothetical protein